MVKSRMFSRAGAGSRTDPDVVDELREALGVPGVGVAVWARGDVQAFGVGISDVWTQAPFHDRTYLPIASASKAFTAALLATLVDGGRLSWDEPVSRHLPSLRLQDPAAAEVSLRDLLSHRTGVPDSGGAFAVGGPASRRELIARLGDTAATAVFRERWQYTNQMYVAAAHVLEVVLGTTWEQALQSRLLTPLGMTGSRPSVPPGGASALARGYGRDDGELVSRPVEPLGVYEPAGGVVSCAGDLLHWLELNASSGAVRGTQLLSPQAIQDLHEPAVALLEWPAVEDVDVIGYGLGWCVEEYRGRRRVSHPGGTLGFSSFVAVLPDDGIGVAVLANLEGSMLPQVLGNLLCDQGLGLPAAPWLERYQGIAEAAAR